MSAGLKIASVAKRAGLSRQTVLRMTKPDDLGLVRLRSVRRGKVIFINPADAETLVKYGTPPLHATA